MSLSPTIPQEALQALRDGKLIDAIKITRERTGLGLKESKDLIDQYLKDHPHEQAQLQQQLAQHSRGGIKFFVLLLAIIALLFWFVAK